MRVYQTEDEIVEGIRDGDDFALEMVYKRHFGTIGHLVLNNSGSEQDAKDVYQEAIIVFYERIKKGGFVLTCQISTFLYAISRRIWLRKMASKGKIYGKLEDFEEVISIMEEQEEFREENFDKMTQSLSQLGEPCRAILEDYYMHNASMQEISLKFGYTNADNAKTQKYKCLQRLKKLFFFRKPIQTL